MEFSRGGGEKSGTCKENGGEQNSVALQKPLGKENGISVSWQDRDLDVNATKRFNCRFLF